MKPRVRFVGDRFYHPHRKNNRPGDIRIEDRATGTRYRLLVAATDLAYEAVNGTTINAIIEDRGTGSRHEFYADNTDLVFETQTTTARSRPIIVTDGSTNYEVVIFETDLGYEAV